MRCYAFKFNRKKSSIDDDIFKSSSDNNIFYYKPTNPSNNPIDNSDNNPNNNSGNNPIDNSDNNSSNNPSNNPIDNSDNNPSNNSGNNPNNIDELNSYVSNSTNSNNGKNNNLNNFELTKVKNKKKFRQRVSSEDISIGDRIQIASVSSLSSVSSLTKSGGESSNDSTPVHTHKKINVINNTDDINEPINTPPSLEGIKKNNFMTDDKNESYKYSKNILIKQNDKQDDVQDNEQDNGEENEEDGKQSEIGFIDIDELPLGIKKLPNYSFLEKGNFINVKQKEKNIKEKNIKEKNIKEKNM